MLCEKCKNAIYCESWGQYKCRKRHIYIYGNKDRNDLCDSFALGEPGKECRCKTCEERRSNEDE